MRLFSRVRGRGYSAGFTIVLMDINHFTKFCTEHGPETGDIVLQYIADILRSSTRCADDVFRVGNDEFALRRGEKAVSDINGDALFAFGVQAIDQQGEVDFLPLRAVAARVSFQGAELVVKNLL